MSENNGNGLVDAVAPFAVGALVGAGLMLLFAPCSGEETRRKLACQAEELKNRAREAIDKATSCCMKHKAPETAAEE